jgi:hypothetical protein
MNTLKFLVECIKQSSSAAECLDVVKGDRIDANIDGFTFEKLFDLCFKFDCIKGITNQTHNHIIGNVSLGQGKKLQCMNAYLSNTKINNSCGTGFADITVEEKSTGKRIYVSSKYFVQDSKKAVAAYDIASIKARTAFDEKRGDELWICMKNKQDFKDKKAKGNKELKDSVAHILDMSDLDSMYEKLKDKLISIENYDDILTKEKMTMYFHQRGIVSNICKLYKIGSKNVLIGAKPRSGKTYICGGIICSIKPKNVIIITPAPTETKPEFLDMFNGYLDFKQYNVIDLDGKTITNLGDMLGSHNIIIVSKQFLQNKVNKGVVNDVIKLKPELAFFDENHAGGCTDMSKAVMDKYAKNSFKVFMTATYQKPLNTWGFTEEECMYWSMEDVARAKHMSDNIQYFTDKFGNDCFDGYKMSELETHYEQEPELCLMSTMFQQNYYAELQQEISPDDMDGFSMSALFELNEKKTDFIKPKAMEAFIKRIGGKTKSKDDKDCMLNRVNRVMELKESSRYNNFYIQLWFLPYGQGRPINKISQLMKKYIKNHSILTDYEVMIINSKHSDAENSMLKDDINNKAEEAREAGKKGMIILVGNKCALGISIRMCDVVMLFNTVESSDKIMQMLYRCMTEDYNNGKRVGVVVDLNMSRVINTLLHYGDNTIARDDDVEKRLRYVAEHLINIDYDQVFDNKVVDHEQLVTKLMNVWKQYVTSSYANYVRIIANQEFDLDDYEKTLLKGIGKSNNKDTKDKHYVEINDNKQDVKSGVEVRYEMDVLNENPDNENADIEIDDNVEISFARDVLTHIIPFTVFMTMNTEDMDIHEMLAYIGKDDKLRAIFNEQCKTWWG